MEELDVLSMYTKSLAKAGLRVPGQIRQLQPVLLLGQLGFLYLTHHLAHGVGDAHPRQPILDVDRERTHLQNRAPELPSTGRRIDYSRLGKDDYRF